MTQKKIFQLAGIIVAAVWVFCITFAVAYSVRTRQKAAAPVAPGQEISTGVVILPSTTTTLPTTTVPSTTVLQTVTIPSLSAPSAEIATNVNTTAESVSTTDNESITDSVPKEKNDIINTYVNGINQLKNTQNFTMNKIDNLNIQITDVQMTGGSALKNAVTDFANGLIAPPEPESYTFIDGSDATTGKTPNETIAPLNVPAQVDPAAVTEAKAEKNADGGYSVTLIIQPESQTLYSPAPNLSTMVQVVDPSSLIPSGATMTELNISYAPSTVKATFDSQGRITAIEHILTSKGGGSGKMIVNVSMTMEGTYTSNYTITY